MIRKPRNQMAHRLVIQSLDTQPDLSRALRRHPEEKEFMRGFLENPEVKKCLKLTDDLVVPNNDGTFDNLVHLIRPKRAIDRNCLELLSDVWTDLEAFVMNSNPQEQPDAHELYDLLADDHIRQFLVACDDVANQRYDPDFDNESSIWEDIYTEQAFLPSVVNSCAKASRANPTKEESPHKTLRPNKVKEAAKKLENVISVNAHQPPPLVSIKPNMVSRNLRKEESSEDEPITDLRSPAKSNMNAYSDKPIEYAEIETPDGASSRVSARKYEESENSFDPTRGNSTRKPSVDSMPRSPVNRLPNPANFSPQGSYDSQDNSSILRRAKPRNQLVNNVRSPNGSFIEDKENIDRMSSMSTKNRRRLSTDRLSNLTAADIERILPTPGKPRLVKLRREQFKEPLGFTIAMKDAETDLDSYVTTPALTNEVVIQRIMAGSLADRSGLLYPGDVLVSFNGKEIVSLEQAHSLIKAVSNMNDVQLVVKAPNKGIMRAHLANKSRSANKNNKIYIKTYISYDPAQDKLMPAGDVGLAFRCGDILELVNSHDQDWWQVRRLNDSNGKARLIPSLMLEEKRQASKNATKKTKSIKKFFSASEPSQKDALLVRSDLWIYEEVVPWPPCTLPCLLIIGPNGVGKRTLKKFLSMRDPKRFCIPITDTTDESLRSSEYRLVPAEKMQADIKNGQYLDWISAKGHYFGIKYSSIREIISRGSTVVMDCEVATVHLLRMPEFNPMVVFVCSPPTFEATKSMYMAGIDNHLTTNQRTDDELRTIVRECEELSERYRHIYNYRLINDDFRTSTDKLAKMIYRHAKEPGWIPAQWAFQMSVPPGGGPQNKDKVYMPGSSSLSALGISALPPGKRTSILAKDPSIISGMNSDFNGSLMGSQISGLNNSGARIYEKRKPNMNRSFQPTAQALVEMPTPSESLADDVVHDNQRGEYFSQKSLEQAERLAAMDENQKSPNNYRTPSELSSVMRRNNEPRDVDNYSVRSSNATRAPSNLGSVQSRFPPAAQENDISSTSSEDD